MSDPDQIDLKLKALGLTLYEIKTLKTLIALSESTAEEIHKQTDIPTPRIYDTIESLQKKGLVRIISGRPKRFVALNLEEGLKNFLRFRDQEYQEELTSIGKISEEIVSLLSDPDYQSQLIIKPDELLEAYSSLGEMQSKTAEIIEKASNEICIFTNVFYWFNQVEASLEKASDRGISIRVLMSVEDDTSKQIAKDLSSIGAKVRTITSGSVLARGTIVDQEQVVFVIWVSPVKQEKFVYRPHFSSNLGIIELFTNNFEYLWEKGGKLSF
ncbi:MAG: TrmB family transcriptional regulator [Candidatus Heimdallarchaeaceae archaeon]|jgi:sugar-specific transcriptional regulator TrmB